VATRRRNGTTDPQRLLRPGLASVVLAILTVAIPYSALARERAADSGRQRERRPEILSGEFSGMVVTWFLPRPLVESWLPQGLRLAKECPYPGHPVIVLFGSIDDLTREKVVTVKPRFGRHYLETFVAVPYLKLDQWPKAEPVFHFVRVYSDSARGTTQGIRRYGWPKLLSPIQTSDESYLISSEGVGTLLAAKMDSSRLKPVSPTNRSLVQIREMLSQPLVLKHDAYYHRYSFNFHFESASILSIPVDLEVREGFMPQMPPRKGKVAGIEETDFGAFHIQCRYTKAPLD